MHSRTRLILERARTSRSKPALTIADFEALARDVERMGVEAFLRTAREVLTVPPRRSRKAHPLTQAFMRAEERSTFRNRREFVDALVRRAVALHGPKMDLPRSRRTMPKLLEAYSERLPTEDLAELVREFGAAHRHSL